MKRGLIFIIAVCALAFCFCLTGCSAGYHIKKAIKKDPTILQVDTLTIRDTITYVTDRVEVDSVFTHSKDTVILQKDNLTVKYYYSRDSVYLYGECESDTVLIPYETKVPVERVVYNESWKMPKYFWWLIFIALGFFVLNRVLPNK